MTPEHYNQVTQPIEVIDYYEMGFKLGNVVKYIARAHKKGQRLEDLNKALDYLNRLKDEKKEWNRFQAYLFLNKVQSEEIEDYAKQWKLDSDLVKILSWLFTLDFNRLGCLDSAIAQLEDYIDFLEEPEPE